MPMYALTVFIGAFLLFQVQPLIGKYLLPWFGGGPGVWTTCLFFFQAFLVAGYAYAHLLTRYCRQRGQTVIHLGLLVLALVSLPIVPAEAWKPRSGAAPAPAILLLLAVNIGLPYLVLAATGPLLQYWSGATDPERSPYRLYAFSNAGSLLALITYPILFEPHLSRKSQAVFWEWGLVVYSLGCATCAVMASRLGAKAFPARAGITQHTNGSNEQTTLPTGRRFLWLAWPCCASVLLLAITNKLCLDVAVFPLLWVLPLGVYLLSFIVCFSGSRWYPRLFFIIALGAGMTAVCWALFQGALWTFWKQVCVYTGSLFICCMVCHGELFRLRPPRPALTEFYLWIALGGALGGLFAAVLAPALFTHYYELHWGLALCGLLVVGIRTFDVIDWVGLGGGSAGNDQGRRQVEHLETRLTQAEAGPKGTAVEETSGDYKSWNVTDWKRLGLALLWLLLLVLVTTLWLQARRPGSAIVHRSRNFYGVLTVFEHRKDETNGHHFLLQHGRITHGMQFVDSQLQTWPTTYYGPDSGLGLVMKTRQEGAQRVGVVGLGTGTVAAYARLGDFFQFYEINPQVSCLATSVFTYLRTCPGKCDIMPGDARLVLEALSPQAFDLLVLDAFDSDSIPVHLLTREAFEVYLRHLKPGGVLAVHVSNHFLDLEPVVAGLARHFGLHSAVIDHDSKPEQWWVYSSTWILLARDRTILDSPTIRSAAKPEVIGKRTVPLWTDDYSSLFPILR